jgi:hypothetical protein
LPSTRLLSAIWVRSRSLGMSRSPDGIAVRFGDNEIVGAGVEGKVRNVINDAAYAQVVIPNEHLANADPDYLAAVEVSAVYGVERTALFTGFVDCVLPEGDKTRIDLVTQTQFMKETAPGGLGLRQIDAREIMWALSVLGGYAEDKVEVEGWEPGPFEVFEVATAIDGILVDGPATFGAVTVYPGGPVATLADGMGPEELRERYAGAPAWALVLKTARTLYEAEAAGIRDIDLALAWLTAKAQYNGVSLPGRPPRSFRREWTSSRVSRRNVVVARGTATGRQWLRALETITARPQLALGDIEDLGLPALPAELPVQVREAISSWRRAAEERDPLSAVVALWESVEFYASGASARKIFEKLALKTVRENATAGLEGEQLKRVQDVLARLNEPPLMVRLKAALEEDRVPHKEEELSVLQKVRRARNDLVHGRSREPPSVADLKYAVAVVNRMLLYRVARLNASATEPLLSGDPLHGNPVAVFDRLSDKA